MNLGFILLKSILIFSLDTKSNLKPRIKNSEIQIILTTIFTKKSMSIVINKYMGIEKIKVNKNILANFQKFSGIGYNLNPKYI